MQYPGYCVVHQIKFPNRVLTRSIRDSETSIDFVQGPPGSRRERVNNGCYEVKHANIYYKYNHYDTLYEV